jgi:deoxyribodipyrimidine photo-lyase
MGAMSPPVIVWFRDDLRLADQAALCAAAESGQAVVPLFILDDTAAERWPPGAASRWWLHHSLASLRDSLRGLGSDLVLRKGDSLAIVTSLAGETGASAVFTGGSANPAVRTIDQRLAAALRPVGCALHRLRTTTLFHPDAVKTKAGGAYSVYTPFAHTCLALGGPKHLAPAPTVLPRAARLQSDRLEDWRLLPTHPDWAAGWRHLWIPGEPAALQRAKTFLATGLPGYVAARDRPATDGTSMLSPHLHFGEISAPTLWHMALEQPNSDSRSLLIRELLWREFSNNLLWQHPELPDVPLRREFAEMPWRDDPKALRAWQRGRTGVPIVDAGMRQLWQTGWMHNRVRMIVASFLVKHLMIRWQEGAAWFWDTLVDADLANNAVNWQWIAGSGADASPYFRIFNPVLQGRKFDPGGAYIRRFVPELDGLDARHVHAPWEAPAGALAKAAVRLGEAYPRPIVGLEEGRACALAAYGEIRNGT